MDFLLEALKAAAEATRLRLLSLCAHADLTVTDLTWILGQSQPRVSRHLKLLCQAGLLDRLPQGTWVYFRTSESGPAADLTRSLVDAIPADDPLHRLDQERLQEVMQKRAERAAEYFRHNAAQWDEMRALYIDEAEVDRVLKDLLPPDSVSDLLDLGTGTGRMLKLFGPQVNRAVGVDLSPEMLNVARAHLEDSQLKNCRVRLGDLSRLPMANASYDAVTMHHVLHFLETPAHAIAEASRVLRPGGKLVIVDFETHGLEALRQDHAHRWLGFDIEDVERWCAASGLEWQPPRRLPGDTLTVGVWCAQRPKTAPVIDFPAAPAV